jgi:hypothetical protein
MVVVAYGTDMLVDATPGMATCLLCQRCASIDMTP